MASQHGRLFEIKTSWKFWDTEWLPRGPSESGMKASSSQDTRTRATTCDFHFHLGKMEGGCGHLENDGTQRFFLPQSRDQAIRNLLEILGLWSMRFCFTEANILRESEGKGIIMTMRVLPGEPGRKPQRWVQTGASQMDSLNLWTLRAGVKRDP